MSQIPGTVEAKHLKAQGVVQPGIAPALDGPGLAVCTAGPGGSSVDMALKHRNSLTIRDLGSEMILYDPKSETFHVLNDSARRIWLMLDGQRDAEEIKREYSGLYPSEDPKVLGKDLLQALEEFDRKGLLEDH